MRKTFMRRPTWLQGFAVVILAVTCFDKAATAAVVDAGELRAMKLEAQKNGYVAVAVHLAPTTLAALHADLSSVKASMAARSAKLTADLGSTALNFGRWSNGIGQIGLYVTLDGLKLLELTTNAISFKKDMAWHNRSRLDNLDGSLTEIARILDAKGIVDVVATVDVGETEYFTSKDGVSILRVPKGAEPVAEKKISDFLTQVIGEVSRDQATARSSEASGAIRVVSRSKVDASFEPKVTLRLTRPGVIALATNSTVRKLVPVGFTDSRRPTLDPGATTQSSRLGFADVLISVRNPLAGGKHDSQSLSAATRSNRRNLEAVLKEAGINAPFEFLSSIGVASGRLTAAQIQSLYSSSDARLLSVELVKPVAEQSLTNSTVLMNLPQAWSLGARGAGQHIAILDAGVQSSHNFLKNSSGVSRVVQQACFGTADVDYDSPCPSPNAFGDSPIGLVGSGEPLANCPIYWTNQCSHGTSAAGVSAGRNTSTLSSPATSGTQGVAPDASIVSINVFSYPKNTFLRPVALNDDVLKALTAIVDNNLPGDVVNMSFGGGFYPVRCQYLSASIASAIQSLVAKNVVVVASTGNDGHVGGINFPACVPGVVKVGAVLNDATGTTMTDYSNIADSANYGTAPGPFPSGPFGVPDAFWLAPTGVVTSVVGSANAVGGFFGTSAAAPHVSGVYALIRQVAPGISTIDASAWINANASYFVPNAVEPCSYGPCVPWKAIRIPNL